MSGLSLNAGARAGVGFGSGNGSFTPLSPASAMPSTATIQQQAYGISGTGASTWNPNISAWGSVGVGVLSIGILVYLWWSLPR